ncbi:MAG: GNAT family N-acetyltransferase [Saprospiraceae bacterium]
MDNILIEFASAQDASSLLELVNELAEYEKAANEVSTQVKDYENGLNNNLFKALVAKSPDHGIIGMALYYPVFSTWNGLTIYLEDFLVKERFRGKGIGKLLFERWIEESKKTGARMLKWQVLDWNESAKNFYLKYNTRFFTGWENGVIYLYK